MTQILLRVRHKVDPLYPHHVDNTQAGDIIVEVPDAHTWGREEVGDNKGYEGNRDWRVVQFPELPFGVFGDCFGDDLEGFRLRRVKHIDLSALPSDMRQAILSNRCVALTGEDAATFLACKRVKPHKFSLIG